MLPSAGARRDSRTCRQGGRCVTRTPSGSPPAESNTTSPSAEVLMKSGTFTHKLTRTTWPGANEAGGLSTATTVRSTAAGGGSPAKAGRRYKELYDAMAPAAQETVEQENIPLGSRFYIRRYFENIRPKE